MPRELVSGFNKSIMITVLNNNTEIPLPYIYAPTKKEHINFTVDYLLIWILWLFWKLWKS
ncbi:hypothetical protein [Staphylothermus marinus]|uniref:hypothetical protein n=1 Tax=Staphylothermus marinus TaxID=2280 RepID=UPI0011E4EB2D|nr:hypothetical protein [Staphylothermus marinus]